jgi:DNA sulfur modification protein DndC
MFQEIKASLHELYLEDERPWLVGFSGGKDSTMLAALIFDVILSIPAEQRKKPIAVLCTDTRVEIPAIAEMIEGTLDHMWKCCGQHDLNIGVNPPILVSECITRQLAVGGQKLWRRLMY